MESYDSKSAKIPRTVYKLFHPDSTDLYIGSTADELKARLANHIYRATSGQPTTVCERMRKLGVEGWKAEALETLVCSKEEIRKREQEFIEALEPNLNSNKAFSPRDENLKLRTEVARLNRLLGNKLNKTRAGRMRELCSCGSKVQKIRMAGHLTTNLHFRRLLKKQDEQANGQPDDKPDEDEIAPEIQVEISAESGEGESSDVHPTTPKSKIPTLPEEVRRDSPKMEGHPGQP